MSVRDEADWDLVRQIIRRWLLSHNYGVARLAKNAGINRSILSRFRRGVTSTLDLNTSLNLFGALAARMDELDRRILLQALGIAPLLRVVTDNSLLLSSTEQAASARRLITQSSLALT